MKNAMSSNNFLIPLSPNTVQDIQFEILTLEDTSHLFPPPASSDGHLVVSNHRRWQLTLTPAGQDEDTHVCVVIRNKFYICLQAPGT